MHDGETLRVLEGLKDFQRKTVEYVFKRMYLDPNPSRRFLVADEVGLGKTLVARGIIAASMDYLQDKVDRIDIIYICSNAAIAAQNIRRLNILEGEHLAMATRLTLLPSKVEGLKSNRVNFVSFTPGTTLDIKGSEGRMEERVILYKILAGEKWLDRYGLINLLQGEVGRKKWMFQAEGSNPDIDEELAEDFRSALRGNRDLKERLRKACFDFRYFRWNVPYGERRRRNRLVGEMRHLLARVCVKALQPDLVILDEFQRFKYLLDGKDETAELARELMSYPEVRVLLLSATPYKMYALDCELDDDHYPDFIRTLSFLLEGDEAAIAAVEGDIDAYRRALLRLKDVEAQELESKKRSLQKRLGKVMVRTERVASTRERDAMVRESIESRNPEPSDIIHVQALDKVVRSLEAGGVVEYWKACPYLLNFAHEYKMKKSLEANADRPSEELLEAIEAAARTALSKEQFGRYLEIDPANARMRALFEDMLDSGIWKFLWIPPSLPYYQAEGLYREAGNTTKALVFSCWNVVPEAIAALGSYEAERRMLSHGGVDVPYEELYRRNKPLLMYKADAQGRLAGMPVLALSYPCVTLAEVADPLAISLALEGDGLPGLGSVLRQAEEAIEKRLEELDIAIRWEESRDDQRWYWAAPALLDAAAGKGVMDWLRGEVGREISLAARDAEENTGFQRHVRFLAEFASGHAELGKPPDDLANVLAKMALGAPGICALRALHRVSGGIAYDDPALLSGAVAAAEGFRGLFNMPESMALLRPEGDRVPYWRKVLDYCVDGNLQAVLDEYVHSLRESLGFIDQDPMKAVEAIAQEIATVLSLRTSRLDIDEIFADEGRGSIEIRKTRLRCRFALRLGDIMDDTGSVLSRTSNVREAFNSPFRPFILATTSIGQEGLDFHTYCHRVYHWNLPSNPVDLEQREGRVNRYKGHAVRKNVALALGLKALREAGREVEDPWDCLFALARERRPQGGNDLVPYWIYEPDEGGYKVERKVPVLAYSREHSRIRKLKRSLALYRMVFGQPRQEDLLAQVESLCEEGGFDPAELAKWAISLSPWELEQP